VDDPAELLNPLDRPPEKAVRYDFSPVRWHEDSQKVPFEPTDRLLDEPVSRGPGGRQLSLRGIPFKAGVRSVGRIQFRTCFQARVAPKMGFEYREVKGHEPF